MSAKFNRNGNANDLLNSNMETLSNELSTLLFDGELHEANANWKPATAAFTNAASGYGPAISNLAIPATNYDAATPNINEMNLLEHYYGNYYNQQLQIQQQRQLLRTSLPAHHLYSNKDLTQHASNTAAYASGAAASLQTMQTSHNIAHEIPTSTSMSPMYNSGASSSTSTPKFECHFLRSYNTSNPNADTVSALSSSLSGGMQFDHYGRSNFHATNSGGGGGGFRKFQKNHQKLNNTAGAGAGEEEQIDYDKVVVDLSVLGLSVDNREENHVLRLFGLFRKMHYYLNDVFPFTVSTYDLNYSSSISSAKSSMPCTMNVQYQVKQATRKCTIFLCDMQRMLNANKMYDRDLFLECEHSLNTLRGMLTQFEMFKRIELEHKRGQFITEEGRAQAECLEILIQKLNDQIRESHLYVHMFNWAMERKYGIQISPLEASALYQQQQQQIQKIQQQLHPQYQQNHEESSNSFVTQVLFNMSSKLNAANTNVITNDTADAAPAAISIASNAVAAAAAAAVGDNETPFELSISRAAEHVVDVERQSAVRYIGYK